MKMSPETLAQIKVQLKRVMNGGGFYAKLLEGIDILKKHCEENQ